MKMEDDDTAPGIVELEDNLADAEKPPEIPAGSYTAEVQDVQEKTSGKGNTYYAIKFVIPEKNLPGTVSEHYPDGAALYWNRQLVPKKGDRRAIFSAKQLILALGLDANTTTIDPSTWMGRSAQIKVRQEKYQGEMRAQITAIEVSESGGRSSAKPAANKPAAGRGRR